uniref:Ribosomal RNA processing protein 1 homolog n=1 Tax=Drosophila melanogaster TaxID=7227 RepID=RRP1L_DROME|nr:Nnp-1 [Drosophila melanogaster]Q9VJZ7.1 RecName: Full=Ribosomal RNA processing protein 1 homolog; AltName: Full=NNP-1 homolog; AltName: Full=RRP1-like protein [Drosophila melanogaster]AAF53287.1 Nnp-1 [Drosophila melanogaster]AAT94500.1 LD23193p [Drosophila melanogaster]AOQ11952.1 Nnp-1-RA [synthetic construct]|eukprot:NP_651976.1 Nnp-1 [Drosophila melanogaster]
MVTRKKPVKRNAEAAEIQVEQEEDASQPKVAKELMVVAQEVKIIRALACNDVVERNRQIRILRKWFKARAGSSFPFNEDDFMRIWKGLYYTMWMSDKPLVQEELAEKLAQMVDSFGGNTACSLAYFSAFMRTMCQEYFGIDQWRMDKFLMLTRRMVRYLLRFLKQNNWNADLIAAFNSSMQLSVMSEQPKSRGMTMHYLDVFFEELAKAANGEITAAQVNMFLRPFVTYIATQRDAKLVAQCRTRVLYHLMYQSDLGRQYSEKYNAWKQMGFPTASIDDIEKLDSGFDEEDDEVNAEEEQPRATSLDPRAGNVDVHMPELPLNADCVLDELQTQLRTNDFNSKRRKGLRKLIQIFETYQRGEFPLGVRTMPKVEGQTLSEMVEQKVAALDKMEDEVFATGRKLKKLNKSKRKRLLQSINFEEVDEHNYDEVISKALPPELQKKVNYNAKVRSSINNAWVVEEVKEAEPKSKKAKKEEPPQQNKDDQTKVKKKSQLKPKNDQSKPKIEDQPTLKAEKEEPAKRKKLDHSKTKEEQSKPKTDEQPKPTPKVEGQSKAKPTPKTKAAGVDDDAPTNGWDAPLEDGEQDIFVPSRKLQVKQANSKLPQSTPKQPARAEFATPQTGSGKHVRIVTKSNCIYPKSDYYRQLKLSPQVPYDANRLPGKSALKPHWIPGPIHPSYKAKRLFNDTL